VNKTDCSDYYHNQEQSPAFPHGDGDCGAPNCDCGNNVPCGFYIWNHSSTTVVHGQTFLEWFRDDYIFDYQGESTVIWESESHSLTLCGDSLGTSPLVSGMYFDDWWPESGGFRERRFPLPLLRLCVYW
jgi:hypothetical protein